MFLLDRKTCSLETGEVKTSYIVVFKSVFSLVFNSYYLENFFCSFVMESFKLDAFFSAIVIFCFNELSAYES